MRTRDLLRGGAILFVGIAGGCLMHAKEPTFTGSSYRVILAAETVEARDRAEGGLTEKEVQTEAGYEYRPNVWAMLYPTIVGTFLVPGSEATSMAVSKAALFDVRSGYIYAIVESYGQKSVVKPYALLDAEVLELDARRMSIGELAATVSAKVKKLRTD